MGDKISDISDQPSGSMDAGCIPGGVLPKREMLAPDGGGCGLDKEVQKEEEHTEEKKEGAPRKAALRKLRDGMKERGRNDTKTRFAARFMERTRGDIAGKIPAQEREFVFHPEGKLFAIAPKINGPEDKNKIPEKGKKAESRA